MVCVPFLFRKGFSWVLELLVVCSWGYICRRIILLPIDLLRGKKTNYAYFSTQCSKENYEFFKNTYCVEWKFRYSNGYTIKLLVPYDMTENDLSIFEQPPKDKKVKITYLRFSKILLQWE